MCNHNDELTVFTSSDGQRCCVEFPAVNLLKFVQQTAASLIAACQTYALDQKPEGSPIGAVLVNYMHWSEGGYVVCLKFQADFLYALVRHAVETKQPLCGSGFIMDIKTAKMVTTALSKFQIWCAQREVVDRTRFGKGIGDERDFSEYVEYNDDFMNLWK